MIPKGKEGDLVATTSTRAEVDYPESDGKPMAETAIHRDVMTELIAGLKDWLADDPMAYVSGNDFIYFVEGDPRRNVAPDVWVVRGIDRSVERRSYKTWLEGGKGPDLVVEATSKSTRREDRGKKLLLYQDDLKVGEYFLFDPLAEYLDPPLQGHRLVEGAYLPIEPRAGRLPSEVLGLHLEADGPSIRLYDPATYRRLPSRLERIQALEAGRRASETTLRELIELTRDQRAAVRAAKRDLEQAESARHEAQMSRLRAEQALLLAEIENEKLRRELEALRLGKKPKRK